ncbi:MULTISPECIES: carbonic anhydrase [unclassified Aeromicrobium]|uniref:beta-class carbonic anhydrase n=1 Tax=unclassified Aeromicrobium TaxID=2633570 RepID=UPI0006F62359|nr:MULTISPECIES: carbonic anhydrase [unclassified Aeromicrobium]KQO38952.1 carbonic anhydrase [Aeromicrobium sp. Leaf245]KQP24808.1 carbonic anhydrase [Aeromicrobium sp. Leaf272]KQP79694.1 carbonic anhydrase [Aeromicrobium sp. Leaf289]KQP82214.1 carbonic anhydrase [Aeromicrobium sp. Leaf291]
MTDFDDLLAANRTFADSFALTGFDGIARAGVAMVTCMDSRIDPLGMIGLQPGDAKILRNPGGRVNDDELVALVLGVHLLQVKRVLVVEHTRCAMASSTEEQIHERVSSSTGTDSTWMSIGPIDDQQRQLRADVHRVTSHPLIPDSIDVGGFLYDVDTGLLQQVV